MDKLRVTAAYFIKESKMTKAAKLQLMNFLEDEATDPQVMALILDGKIQGLDEMAEEIVNDRFKAFDISEASASVMGKFIKAKDLTHTAMQGDVTGWKRYRAAKALRKAQAAAEKSGRAMPNVPSSKVIKQAHEKPAMKTAVVRTGAGVAAVGTGVALNKRRKNKKKEAK
jgi:hypothetical protein